MTPQQIVAIGLRFIAIFWVLYMVNHAYALFTLEQADADMPISKAYVWLLMAAQLVVCAAFWLFPMTIAGKLVPKSALVPPPPAPPGISDWLALGSICIGLLTLASVVPDLAYWAVFLGLSDTSLWEVLKTESAQAAMLISSIVRLLAGLWLVFGAKGISAFLMRVRTAGVAKPGS